ncbi:hypothetical protein [Hymenobacter lapidiphilus]|uniref:hypothetical protein n=1 Tax=Hymenobacter sp. CCM 8763 TaxID=2303334 RepID=UPI0011C17B1D|nr:hypothetical protein [Hymenobacter sp. CCM 8763]
MDSNDNPSYSLDGSLSQRAHQWAALLARVLPEANYLELNQFLQQGPLPDMLREAKVPLPQQVGRGYGATHRFWLMPTLRAYCQKLAYDDWRATSKTPLSTTTPGCCWPPSVTKIT